MKKIMLFITCICLLSVFLIAEHNVYAQNTFKEDAIRISIYDDYDASGYYHILYDGFDEYDVVNRDEDIYLLLYNGSFIPFPKVIMFDNWSYIPVDTVQRFPGFSVKQVNEESIIIINGKKEASFSVEDSQNTLVKLKDGLYVPLRELMEDLGAAVSYLDNLCYGNGSTDWGLIYLRNNVKLIAIENRLNQPPEISVEEGLAEIKALSQAVYQNLVESMAARGDVFHSGQPDYADQAVTYTSMNIGCYYVYKLEGFEAYPILFNKYTGQVFSEKAGLPFINISEGFINISWLYQ